jgi:glycerol kinase
MKKTENKYILAIDQGTTGSTLSLVNAQGEIVGQVDQDFQQIYPKPGWVEHRPEDIWKSVALNIPKLLRRNKVQASQIAGIGITNQRETVVMWNRKTSKPLHNALVWQDRRTTEFCESIKSAGHEALIKLKTGLVIDPYFSASKIHWLLKNLSPVIADIRVGTIDSFLIDRLSHGQSHITDVSNASRTQLMNIETCDWDDELLKIFSVPKSILPRIVSSSGLLAKTKGLKFLPDDIPISGIAGDQQAALFGQNCIRVGEAKCTFGTGSFLLINTGEKQLSSNFGLLTTVAWRLKDSEKPVYALEGGAFMCGAAVQFLRDQLGFIKTSSEVESLAKKVSDSQGVEFVPALTGLGAPYWDAGARGLICGLTRGSTRAHIARATLEAMALQNTEILIAMQKDLGHDLLSVKVDGGASSNNLLMQLQADYLGTKVIRPKNIESTSLGAAYLAGLGVGFWKMHDLQKIWKVDKIFAPKITAGARGERLALWKSAVKRALTN